MIMILILFLLLLLSITIVEEYSGRILLFHEGILPRSDKGDYSKYFLRQLRFI